MIDIGGWEQAGAREDFRRARAQAVREQIRSRLRGQSAELLCYDDVREQLQATSSTYRGLHDIPLDSVVGSVGRCGDFSRTFLPRRGEDEWRWTRVQAAVLSDEGVPPIEVYQIGDVYFVLDGNHRVSVARQLGATHIQAYVTESYADLPLTSDVQPDELIVKAEHAGFLGRTGLSDLRPDADLSVSVPGQHPILEEHISVHRYFMGIDQNRPIPYQDAVAHWYDTVYLPVVEAIRAQNLLQDFPDRTEADLYLWLSEHRVALGEQLDWEVTPEVAARDLAAQSGRERARLLTRLSSAAVEALLGRAPGEWRQEQLALRQSALFIDVLVAVTGREGGWVAVESAIELTKQENGRLIGIHIVSAEAERNSESVRALEAEFARRCQAAGVAGTLVVEVGEIGPTICSRARWTSLVVVGLAHPPGDRAIDRLGSGLRWLIEHCPGPILAVPEAPGLQARQGFDPALLAYDGSRKANEALYLAAYLAGQREMALVVLTVDERKRGAAAGDAEPRALLGARKYLEDHGVDANYVTRQGGVAEAILETAHEYSCGLVIMGGYGFSPPLQIVLGSAVDQVLRECKLPVLICR